MLSFDVGVDVWGYGVVPFDVVLKKIETPAIKKTFDEIAKPLRDVAKQVGLTKADVKKAIKDVRNAA